MSTLRTTPTHRYHNTDVTTTQSRMVKQRVHDRAKYDITTKLGVHDDVGMTINQHNITNYTKRREYYHSTLSSFSRNRKDVRGGSIFRHDIHRRRFTSRSQFGVKYASDMTGLTSSLPQWHLTTLCCTGGVAHTYVKQALSETRRGLMQPSASSLTLYYKTTDENDRNLCPRFGHYNIH